MKQYRVYRLGVYEKSFCSKEEAVSYINNRLGGFYVYAVRLAEFDFSYKKD